jgi:hypothetical protein
MKAFISNNDQIENLPPFDECTLGFGNNLLQNRLQSVSQNFSSNLLDSSHKAYGPEILERDSTRNLWNKRNKRNIQTLLKHFSSMKVRKYLHNVQVQNLPTSLEESHSKTIRTRRFVTIHSEHYLPNLLLLKGSLQPTCL